MSGPDEDVAGRRGTRVLGAVGLLLLVAALCAMAALFTVAPLDRRAAEGRLDDEADSLADRLSEAAVDGFLTDVEVTAVTGPTGQYRPVLDGQRPRIDVHVELETTLTGTMNQGKTLRRCYRFEVTPEPAAATARVDVYPAPMNACAVLGEAIPTSADI